MAAGINMDAIVEASYRVWRLDKLNGARAAWKVPEVRHTWELRWRQNYDTYIKERMDEANRNRPA